MKETYSGGVGGLAMIPEIQSSSRILGVGAGKSGERRERGHALAWELGKRSISFHLGLSSQLGLRPAVTHP